MSVPPGQSWRDRLEVVGYSDLHGRPAFKLAMQEIDGRWYLYLGHLWHRGWSVVDVTEPRAPRVVRFVEGPANTWTGQLQVADRRLVTGLERTASGWGGEPDAPFAEGLLIWDVSDLATPRRLGHFETYARQPREVGFFVPPDPRVRRRLLPRRLVAQSEDVLVDARGFVYVTDKNHGLYVLEYQGGLAHDHLGPQDHRRCRHRHAPRPPRSRGGHPAPARRAVWPGRPAGRRAVRRAAGDRGAGGPRGHRVPGRRRGGL